MGTEHAEAVQLLWDRSAPRERVTTRARSAVLDATPPPPLAAGMNPRTRRRTFALGFAVLALGAAAALAVTRPWDQTTAPTVPATREAAERIVADPLLANLAWLRAVQGADGGPPRVQEQPATPSLRFPPGVTYDEAFQRMIASLRTSGALPAEATLEPPLPAGRVLELGTGPDQGLALDLRAARGYDLPSGWMPTGFQGLPDWSPADFERHVAEAHAQGLVVPLDAIIPTPTLAPCQILDPADPAPTCRLSPPLP